MDQRRKSFKTVYNGSDENRVQTPDRQHHDSDNMSSRLRERRSTRFGELSTAKETANTSNVRTVTNTIKQPNTEYSTKDRQALKRLIIALGNKYAETIVLHRKASMEHSMNVETPASVDSDGNDVEVASFEERASRWIEFGFNMKRIS
ncbi:hypothetical protein L5515_017291 [Caenorhabditis briggsae]|uniref:Uncharacterized protein n=1 Tax=Caenorhabditis briggsae TaxID=6238 RepID=A0AAE9F915_CAEBR|nr:hypothetical protein L5515_017291 [Caenorhabditis briggsae]